LLAQKLKKIFFFIDQGKTFSNYIFIHLLAMEVYLSALPLHLVVALRDECNKIIFGPPLSSQQQPAPLAHAAPQHQEQQQKPSRRRQKSKMTALFASSSSAAAGPVVFLPEEKLVRERANPISPPSPKEEEDEEPLPETAAYKLKVLNLRIIGAEGDYIDDRHPAYQASIDLNRELKAAIKTGGKKTNKLFHVPSKLFIEAGKGTAIITFEGNEVVPRAMKNLQEAGYKVVEDYSITERLPRHHNNNNNNYRPRRRHLEEELEEEEEEAI
jgi:hypothetical protein